MRVWPCALLLLSACAVFVEKTPDPPPLEDVRFDRVHIEFINWQTEERARQADLVEDAFRACGLFESVEVTSGSDGWHVEIVNLEYPGESTIGQRLEERPLRETLGFVNRAIAVRTFLIIPVYRPVDRRVRFSVYRAGHHVKDYEYGSKAHVFVGWLPLLAFPWSESRELQIAMVNITHQFITEAARDGILRDARNPL